MSRDRRLTRKSLHIDALRGAAILAAAQYHYGSKSKLYERANLPALAQGVDSLGWVLFRQGRLQDALEQLDRAVALSPDEAEIHYHRGEVLRALGRRDEAMAAYALAIEKASDPAEKARYQAAAKKRGRR